MTAPLHMARTGQVFCLVGAGIAGVGLIGWLAHIRALVTLLPGQLPMLPNTAIGLLLTGIAGVLHTRAKGRGALWISMLAAAIVLVIGLGTLAEYAFGMQLGLDQFFIRTEVGPLPGRPSPLVAVILALLSAGVLLSNLNFRWRVLASEWVILSAGLVAFVALLGQIFGAGLVYRFAQRQTIGVAVPTALSCMMISTGLLLQRDAKLMKLITGSGPGSMLLRRLTPWAILAPASLGLVGAYLFEAPDLLNVPLVFAGLTALSIAISVFLLAITATSLNRTHDLLDRERADARNLFDMASDGIFVADLSGHFTDVNEAACRMFGYSREELIGKTILDMIRPEDIDRLWQDRARFLEGQASVAEWMMRRKDGSFLPVEVSAKILPDGRWQAFDRDISERKRAEDARRLSEAKFSGIVSTSSDAIISIDETQKIILFNEGAEKMFGRSSAEMIGRSMDEILPERFRTNLPQGIESFMASAENARQLGAVRGLRSSGQEFPADAAISKISLGGTTIMTATLRDVTIQKRFERIQRLFGDLGAALSTLDFDELLNNIAQLVVRELADLCIVDILQEDGAARRVKVMCRDEDAARISDTLMRAPGSASAVRQWAESIKGTTEPVLIEEITPAAAGSLALDEEQLETIQNIGVRSAMIAPLCVHGIVLGRLSLLSLQAHRRYGPPQLQLVEAFAERAALSLQNARLYEAARRASSARDDMLGFVAHDLRNPLQIVATHVGVLKQLGSETASEIGDEISDAVNRMNRLIQDLLDVGRMEAGQFSLRPRRIAPNELLSNSLSADLPLAASRSLVIRSEPAPELPDVWGDRDRLLQVFQNLIGNSIKYTAPGGRITLCAKESAGEVTFSVSDTGSGIDPDDLPRVFDRFWQLDKSSYRGAGLGLAIVKGIVEAHRGRVWVDSVLGQGSTFYFTLPLASAHRVGRTDSGASASLKGER